MADEKWQKVREIVDSALRQHSEVRAGFVNEACGSDRSLLREVESLLSSLCDADSFMETPAIAGIADVIDANRKRLEEGDCLGHYEIVRQIGAGGMGQVYLANDKKLDRKVAVKVLNEEFSRHESNLNRFIREAKAASSLNHPSILIIHEIGEYQDTHYIVSEFIEGKTLREIFKERAFELGEIVEISVQVAGALSAAHAAHIVHRDIKPENIMIRPDGVVKVLDFGLAKLFEQKNKSVLGLEDPTVQENATAIGMILGTVAYMSPEQARGERVDARTDIFSFGTLLYEMLTGEQPFKGETANHTIVAILEKEPPPVSQFIIGSPPEIEGIIKRCLAKKANERYSASKVLLYDLKELEEELTFQSKLERISRQNKNSEAGTKVIRSATTAETEKRNSIAVLPFTNMSAQAENEYFCDGLAEELLNALAKIEDLKVAARTSAFSFKNKNVEISEIGKTLNVTTLLEGSVRRSGNRLRISVQLVNVADGYHLWSDSYDRQMRDIFDVQDEITLAVVSALKVKLLGEEKAAILKRYTDNPEAYDLYLKGLYHCYKWTDEGLRKSFEYFEKALEKDPEFAPAYAKMADYYHFSSHIGLFSPHEILPKWKAAAQRALEIDEGLADAHLAMAHIYFYYERDWAEAERAFEQAVKLNPNSTYAHKHYGLFLASRERFDEAVAEGKKALELDPLSIAVNMVVGFIYLFVDRLDDALRLVQRMAELDSSSPQANWVGGSLLMANGDYEKAIERFQKALILGDNQMALSKLGCAYGLAGKRDEALKVLDQLFEMRERHYADPFNIARVYAGLGDNDNIFKWLERAADERSADLVFLKRYAEAGAGLYLEKNFSTDSRYRDILLRAGLPTDKIKLAQGTDETKNAHAALTEEYLVGSTGNSAAWYMRWPGIAGLSLLLIGAAVLTFFWRQNAGTPSRTDITSLAVLPLENLSGDASQDYFADGMTEALIGNLSQIGSLKVISRTSVMRYKRSGKSIPEIAKELGVDGIIEGSVQRSDDRIRITTQLIHVASDSPIWTKNYDRSVSDIWKLQSEIAQAVAGEIRIQLTQEEQRQFGKAKSIDPRATEAFLLGKHYFHKWTKESERQAVEQFQKAVGIEPDFPDAWAGLADASTVQAMVGNISIREAEKQTRDAALRALEIDPQNSAAHISMCFIYNNYDFDWARSENSCKRGLELDPNNAKGHFAYAYVLARLERWDEMAEQMETAIRLDPAEPWWPSVYGSFLIQARRFEEAEKQVKRAIVIDPHWRPAYQALSDLYVELGRFNEAIEVREKNGITGPVRMAYIYARMGNRQKALDFLNRSSDQNLFELAMAYTALEDFDKAFEVINQSLDRREGFMFGYGNYLVLDKLKTDPRWKDVSRRINLP